MAQKFGSRKKILLLGGGHANIQVLHQFAKVDLNLFELTLISEFSMTPYSGMIPSYMAGVFQPDQFHFDLKKICERFGFNFIEDRVEHIMPGLNQVKTFSGKVFEYDICAINLGIVPKQIGSDVQHDENIFYVKPISKFTSKWETLKNQFSKNKSDLDFSIIGGGAAAFEVAIACRMLYPQLEVKIKIIAGKQGLLPDSNFRTRHFAKNAFREQSIELIEGKHVIRITREQLVFDDGTCLSRNVCIVGTSAEAPGLLASSDLPTNQKGFVEINDYLLVDGFENIFAAGDCSHFKSKPLAKAGVFAVREGPILSKNIMCLLTDRKKLRKYKPQNHYLTILVSGEKQAIACYGKMAFQGRIAWWLKYFIDLHFMKRFK